MTLNVPKREGVTKGQALSSPLLISRGWSVGRKWRGGVGQGQTVLEEELSKNPESPLRLELQMGATFTLRQWRWHPTLVLTQPAALYNSYSWKIHWKMFASERIKARICRIIFWNHHWEVVVINNGFLLLWGVHLLISFHHYLLSAEHVLALFQAWGIW